MNKQYVHPIMVVNNMLIRPGDPLFSNTRYQLYRVWNVAWVIAFIMSLYFWETIGLIIKVIIFSTLGLTLPDDMRDLGRSYKLYKQNWNKINKRGK